MRHIKEIKQLLKDNDARFLRKNKHEVWKLPNNQLITISSTSSDVNLIKSLERRIKKLNSIG